MNLPLKDITAEIAEPEQQQPEQQEPEFDLNKCLQTVRELRARDIPERKKICGEWLAAGDTGMIFAKRGVGKTWFSMALANAISRGSMFGEWRCASAGKVVYLDTEMHLKDLQKRADVLNLHDDIHFITAEDCLDKLETPLNLNNPFHQKAIEQIVNQGDVLFIDNLSTGSRGGEENSNDDAEMVLDFQLRLRSKGVTVIINHHAGKNGTSRGNSRKEDWLNWIIELKAKDDDVEDEKTVFYSSFSKIRGASPADAYPAKWELKFNSDQRANLEGVRYAGIDSMLTEIKSGLTHNSELAEALGASKSSISKWAKKLKDQGLIDIKKGTYTLKA